VSQAENRVSEAENLINLLQKEVDKLEGLNTLMAPLSIIGQ